MRRGVPVKRWPDRGASFHLGQGQLLDYLAGGTGWKSGATSPSANETTNNSTVPKDGRYHDQSSNGVSGSAYAHAMNANVDANISHSGHWCGRTGSAMDRAFAFVAKSTHTVTGAKAPKVRKATH